MKLWEIINQTISRSSNKTCNFEKLKIGNAMLEDSNDIANQLASYCANVGPKYATLIKKPGCNISEYLKRIKRNGSSLFLIPTNRTEIEKIISSLPNKTSSGYDLLNNKLLKLIKSEISLPLKIAFNYSLQTGSFPSKNEIYRNSSIVQKANFSIMGNKDIT